MMEDSSEGGWKDSVTLTTKKNHLNNLKRKQRKKKRVTRRRVNTVRRIRARRMTARRM